MSEDWERILRRVEQPARYTGGEWNAKLKDPARVDVRVALAQIAPRLGDLDANLALHARTVARARRERADVVVFPESVH